MQSSRKRKKGIAIKEREKIHIRLQGGWWGPSMEEKKSIKKRNDDDEPADTEAVAI